MDTSNFSAMPGIIRQAIVELITTDRNDCLSETQKTKFKSEVKAFSQREVLKTYPKEDEDSRPIVVGFQQKLEQVLIDNSKKENLDQWKITAAIVTPKPGTDKSINPDDQSTWDKAIPEKVRSNPASLYTVTQRSRQASELTAIPNMKMYGFYPESGLQERTPAQQEIYKDFVRLNTNFADRPMNNIELEAREIGAIYIMQPPNTFMKKNSDLSASENPLKSIDDELSQLQSKSKSEKNLRDLVFINGISSSQAADAGEKSQFLLLSGPLSNPEIESFFNLKRDTINKGITDDNKGTANQESTDKQTEDKGTADLKTATEKL